MLKNTFCHIPGVGARTERGLWAAGLATWADVEAASELPFSPRRAEAVRDCLAESVDQLADGNAEYFYRLLPSREQWRLFGEFGGSAAYLDIETTGLGGGDDYVTTICLYDGRSLRHYVYDRNLLDFREDIRDYGLIVTYNGKCFDLPFLREFLGCRIETPHIDLRYVLGGLGYRGGLKGCERRLGLDRGGLADVDGFFAVLLWWDWHNNGNERALETLLAYNALDVVNLARLMPMAYNLKLAETPFARSLRLPVPPAPPVPFRPDAPTIERIRRDHLRS